MLSDVTIKGLIIIIIIIVIIIIIIIMIIIKRGFLPEYLVFRILFGKLSFRQGYLLSSGQLHIYRYTRIQRGKIKISNYINKFSAKLVRLKFKISYFGLASSTTTIVLNILKKHAAVFSLQQRGQVNFYNPK